MPVIITDGFSIFYKYIGAISAFFVTIFGIGYYATRFILHDKGDTKVRLLASLSIGYILLSLIAFVFIVLFHISGLPLQISGYLMVSLSIYAVVEGIKSSHFTGVFSKHVLVSIFALFFLLILRLAFLKYILLPPYSDSPVHYQIVSNFLHPEEEQTKLSLQIIFKTYYHFGFHSLATWLVSITGFRIGEMISLIGQLSLVIAPASIIFLIYTLTLDINGALFAGLLTSIGWLMPAFAVNWGKYPALLAITISPVIASLPIFLINNRFKRLHSFAFVLILLAGITLIHTRIIICLFFVFISYFIVSKLQLDKEFAPFKSVRFTLLFLLFLWPWSQIFVDFYKNVPILILLLLLTPFAFHSYPATATGVMIFLSGLSTTMLIPNLFTIGGPTLLDRQFLAMILYIPLATIGGLGFGGLVKKLENKPVLKYSTSLVCITCVFVSLTPQIFYPDQCCSYFNKKDELAFQWIQENSSSHTLYFISTFNDGDRAYGTDAGIWISSLTKNATNKLPFNTKWNSEKMFNAICPQGKNKTYVYMGGRATSFNDNQLSLLSWATPVFQAGEVVIYEISSCVGKE